MAEMVEHQATVETGLKMKIKRKNPTQKTSSSSSEPRCKSSAAHEDKNGNIKSRKARQDNRAEVVTDILPPPTATPQTEETVVEETASKEPEERPQKRKRNAKSIRQMARIQNGADFEVTAKGNKSKLDPTDNPPIKSSSQVSSPKEKPKNGKICPPEKNSRKRAASVCPVAPVIAGSETPKTKSLRINAAYDKDAGGVVVDEKNVEPPRKSGYSGIKNDPEESLSSSPRKADSKIQPTHEVPSQTAQDLPEDPYEFVAKVEDVIQTPVKKFKSDKADVTCAAADPSQQSSAGGGLAIGGGSVVGLLGGHHDMATETCSVGVTTDPDCLGPCEPGTSVILEGIVWSESNNGILVVNVTWRGKTYVGTLMDTTKHHWASPRFREDSPVPELDWRSPKSSKRTSGTTPVIEVLEGRRLRKCRRNIPAANGACTTSSKGATTATSSSTLRQSPPLPSQLETNSSRRRARMADSLEAMSLSMSSNCAMTQPLKKARAAATESDELLLECTLVNCNKKFKHISGLHYHQSHAHRKSLAVDEAKPADGGKQTESPGGSLEVPPLPADMVEREEGTMREDNENCDVVESSSITKDLSADVVVVVPVVDAQEEGIVAGSGAQSVCCSMDEPVSSDVTLLASSSSIALSSSCPSDTPLADISVGSGPGSDGKHQPKLKESHASPPPPRPSKSVALEPLSESEQSSVSTATLPPRPQAPHDPKTKDGGGGKTSRPSDTDKSHSVETKVSGSSPAPSATPQSKAPTSGSTPNKPLPCASDDKEGKSCVVSSTADHQLQSEATPTGPLSTSAPTAVSSSSSSSSGFPVGVTDNKSPDYSDISDSAEQLLTQSSDHHGNGQQHHQQQQHQGRDGDAAKKQPKPTMDNNRQQKSKHETTGAAATQSNTTSVVASALLHPSAAPLSNGQTTGSGDPVRQQRMKDIEPKDCFSPTNNSYTKPTTPEELKPVISSRAAYHADLEADAHAKEHRMWLENLHHHHHHHQNSAMASSMAMASSAAAAAMNMMPYGYGLDQAAYHLQFLSQNPETRSHYERWLMEQSHYLQQQHHHHHHQQQRCFNKLMQAEVERGPPPPSSDSKPVDMTSKGQIHPPVDSTPGLAPPYAGKPKTGVRPDGKPADSGKSQHKTSMDGGDWMSKHRDSLPSSNGVVDSCGDPRKPTSAPQPSGRNSNVSKEKLDSSTRPEQLHKGCKDPTVQWERNERVATTMSNKSSGAIGPETTRSSPDHLGVSSHLPPISKASNPVGNISPYHPSGNLLKNFVQDSSHSSLIGYNAGGCGGSGGGGASFMDLSETNSISPNGKFLDLDSKQVVTGSNHRRSGDGRHTLDVLRYQSAMYHGKQPTTAEHLGSSGPKQHTNRSTVSKDFHEEQPGHHAKDGKGSPSGHSSPLTLRHLHTHHHTHVVGAAYPMYGSYSGLMSPVPAIVPPGPPVIAPTYLPK